MRLRLPAQAPFHLEATVRVLQRRPTNRVDIWANGRWLRVLDLAGARVLAEVTNRGTIDAPELVGTLHGPVPRSARAEAVRMLRAILGLDVDPARLEETVSGNRALRAATRPLRGMRPPRYPALFEAFANVVPFQQVSIDAGTAITGRLVERFGAPVDFDGGRCFAFPSAEAVAAGSVAELRACGLSARKAATLRALADAVASSAVSAPALAAMSTPAALETLTALPGIGPWSAALVLLRGLGRLDVFPPGDVGARKSLSTLMRLPASTRVERYVERFGDHRGYVYFCGIGTNLVARGLVHAAP